MFVEGLSEVPEGVHLTEIPSGIPTMRSHHVRFAAWAMGFGKFAGIPEEVAEKFTQFVKSLGDSKVPYYRTYAQTTVGISEDDYQKNLALGLREFIDAPPDAKYTIVEEHADTIICEKMKSCGLADHCLRRMAEIRPQKWFQIHEKYDMEIFLQAAQSLGMELEVGWTLSDNIDVPQEPVRYVTLTVGEIKQVICFLAVVAPEFFEFNATI